MSWGEKPPALRGRIVDIDRLEGSAAGNPRYAVGVIVEGGAVVRYLKTAVDASVAYGITNREHRRGQQDFWLDSRGHITEVRPAV